MFILTSEVREPGMVRMLIIPALERRQTGGFLGLIASQCSLLGMFRAREGPGLVKKKKKQGIQYLRIVPGWPLTPPLPQKHVLIYILLTQGFKPCVADSPGNLGLGPTTCPSSKSPTVTGSVDLVGSLRTLFSEQHCS